MRRRQFVSLLGGAAPAPLTASRVYADQPGCGIPIVRDDGWPLTSVNEDKLIDRNALCGMADRLAASAANIHAVLVARGGKLHFERYFRGADEIPGRIYGSRVETVTFDADTLHNMKSVSKSVASLAVGIAIDRGLIPSVNEPIWSFFPELSDLRSAEKEDIRLSHVLSMSMGLEWVEATPATGDFNNDEARMWMAWEFARATFLEPLGITSAEWTRYRGDTNAGGGLRLRPRDMAKIGQLVLAGGRLERRPDRFESMDRDLDGTEAQGHRRSVVWIPVVARSLPAQWT